tara:strand:- start:1290 stop:1520 length:231 start_codon:yes stop_codon:yes gene_type:complete
MSTLFSSPKTPAPPPIPPPPPAAPFKPADPETSATAEEKERIKRRKGISSTILTGPQGLLPEQMPVSSPGLLGSKE